MSVHGACRDQKVRSPGNGVTDGVSHHMVGGIEPWFSSGSSNPLTHRAIFPA